MPTPLLIEEMESTDAKNRFGDAMAAARAGRAVSIKWHGKPAAYLIPAGLFPAIEAAQGRPAKALKRLEERLMPCWPPCRRPRVWRPLQG